MVNWENTCLGPLSSWSTSFRASVDLLFSMSEPALLLCGADELTLYNTACTSLLGDLHPGLLGRNLADGWPALADVVQRAVHHAWKGHAARLDGRVVAVPRGGRITQACVDISCHPVFDHAGEAHAVLVIADDSAARQNSESRLRHDASKLEAIFRTAQVGLSEIAPSGAFIRANEALMRMLERSEDDMHGLTVADVTHPEDLPHSVAALGRLMETGKPVSLDKRYVCPDGRIVWANSSISLLDPMLPGEPNSLLAVTVDLTDRVLAKHALEESEARFRALAEASPLLIWQVDAEGKPVYMNPTCHELLEQNHGGAADWKSLLHPDDAADFCAGLARAQQERVAFQRDFRMRTADGHVRWMKAYTAPWQDSAGAYAGHVGISIDVSDAVQAQQELQVSNERLNLAIEGAGDGVWDWDLLRNEITYSPRMLAILEYPEKDYERRFESWLLRVHPADLPRVRSNLQECIDGKCATYKDEYRIRSQASGWKWILIRSMVVGRDGQGRPLRMTGTATDISEQRRSQEVVWQHANFDALTGLPNRRLFRDRLDHEVRMAQRSGAPFALLFIDLDHFKEANDLLGHDAGDKVLLEASARIQSCVRKADTVARLGGDEFTVILTDMDKTHFAETTAKKINTALAVPYTVGHDVIHLSASIGITLHPYDAVEPEDLIRHADQAMYVAKNNGRNQFRYFTAHMHIEAQERLRLIADLRLALEHDELELFYQPVVNLRSGRVVKAEALLRWNHPQHGRLTPTDFVGLAEETGLILDIGDWVFKSAVSSCQRWRALAGDNFQISVNRSPAQFTARTPVSDWPEHLSRVSLPGHCMSVEITEASLLNASTRVTEQLKQFHDVGMEVAIDDFGTGYSSLAYLKKFDIDYLKIDQTFVGEMHRDENDRAIVRSVTAMAHELGLQVIAEGIEIQQHLDLLIAAGCDYGQGFYFSKPVPSAQFEHLLKRDMVAGA
jgi:diguanylate cyclase (GGDEF)-like protein/PAS domain S-box-containing protein